MRVNWVTAALASQVAFAWIQFGFAGLLEMDQVLHLWDRVIGEDWPQSVGRRWPVAVSHNCMSPGYMDPLLLAVAAAAIFLYRADALMRVIICFLSQITC